MINRFVNFAREPFARDLFLVVGYALALRLLFLALTADTYDYDEFVLLLFGRDYADGALPYHDFFFFHPPGVLYLVRLLAPLTNFWWPFARLGTAIVDTCTAAMVWRIGALLYGRKGGLVSGVMYAFSPVALISGGRLGQDPLLTALGIAGLLVLLSRPGWRAAIVAGVLLGAAVCIKYPALYFLPVYVLAAPRRAATFVATAGLMLVLSLAPFHDHLGALYQQTVTFQSTRWLMDATQRWQTTVLYWLLANPLAAIASFTERAPLWLLTGFGLGGTFVLSSQVYYHYFVPVAPFAALLAAPLLVRARFRVIPVLIACGIAISIAWGLLIAQSQGSVLYVTAAHLSDITPTVRWLEKNTTPKSQVLADRFEYPYLADRPVVAHYFWNVGVLVDAHYLERRLPARGAVVLSHGASSGFPYGLTQYLDGRYTRVRVGVTDVWRLAR